MGGVQRCVWRRGVTQRCGSASASPLAAQASFFGDSDLRVDRARAHGDAGLVAGGDDLFETKLAVAENSDKGDEHGDLR